MSDLGLVRFDLPAAFVRDATAGDQFSADEAKYPRAIRLVLLAAIFAGSWIAVLSMGALAFRMLARLSH